MSFARRIVVSLLRFVLVFAVALGSRPAFAAPAATSTTLSVTVNGVPVPVVPAKSAVVLTAKVLFNLTSVFQGQVDFCNASTASCTDINLLGTAQVTAAGTATLKFVPGPGNHLYRAVFKGTQVYGRSTSNTATLQVLAATGAVKGTIGIEASGVQGNYSLLGTVATNAPSSPTGPISFVDVDNANYSLGSAPLASTGAAGITFGSASTLTFPNTRYPTGTSGEGDLVVADFNGDGIPDIAVIGDYRFVTLMLGRGDGTFTSSTIATANPGPSGFTSFTNMFGADFNGDGNADLILTDASGVRVLLGHGDGTFTSLPPQSLPLQYILGVGDFNGDGVVDFASVAPYPATPGYSEISIYLGNGDGTFTLKKQPSPILLRGSDHAAIGDFNGDGFADIATPDFFLGVVRLFLGNGDGTFRQGVDLPFEGDEAEIAAGDLNRDGNLDIVISQINYSPSLPAGPTIVFLGNGDGTFKRLPEDPRLVQYADSIVLADFNGDGIPDLVLPRQEGGYTSVFIGNGDGTFTPDTFTPTVVGPEVYSLAVADFNGDGQSDIAQFLEDFNNPALLDSNVNVLLAQAPNTTAAYLNNVSPVGTGFHNVVATYAGDTNNGAGVSIPVAVLAQQVTTKLALTVTPVGGSAVGKSVTLSTSLNQHSAQNHEAGGVVTFTSNGKTIGTASVSNGAATLTTGALPLGTSSLKASYGGDVNFLGGSSAETAYVIANTLTQTIIFPQPASPAYAATAAALNAVASSGLPVTYSVISGPAVVVGSTVTYIGAGTVVLEADQPGDGNYPAAAPVRQTVTVVLLTNTLGTQSSPVMTLVTIVSPGTLSTLTVTAQGAAGLDFNLAPGGTCLVGLTYSAGQTCTAYFTFKPQHPGLRYGGIALADGTGALLANSYVLGLGNGPQVLYNPPNQTLVGAGFGGLSGVAVDGSGNVYGSDIVNNGIYQVLAATGATRLLTTPPGTPRPQPTDVYVDGSGNVFYTTRDQAAEILAVNGVIPAQPTVRLLATLPATVSAVIDGMKVDQLGNVFLAISDANVANSSIQEIVAVNGVIPQVPLVRTLVTGLGGPTGVAIDVQGNVYFSDQIGHQVYEIIAVDGSIPTKPQVRVVSSAFSVPTNLAFDVSGNLYVPDFGSQDVKELLAVNLVLPASPAIVSLGRGLLSPQGVAIDSGGSLFVADEGASQVVKLAYGSAPTLTFAATQIGATSSDSPRSVTITNGGNTPLSIPAPATGTNPAISTNFSIGAASTCPTLTPGMPTQGLAPGASCTTAVSFMPTSAGTLNGTLVRTDDNLGVPGSTQTIVLNGVGLGIPPTIVFMVPNHTFGDPPFTVGATSNSPGAISYSVVSGPATINGTTVTLTGGGVVTLQASQVASGIYAAGTQNASFTVAKKPQTITFAQPSSPVAFSTNPVALMATSSSGLPVSFSIVSGPGSISGSSLTIKGGGVIVIAADQPGDANYAPATQAQRTVTVLFGLATVTLGASPNPAFLLNPVTFTAAVTAPSGSPGGIVVFQEGSKILGSAAINGGSASLVLTTLAVGSHTIIAAYQGDASYALALSPAAVEVIQDFSLTITNPNVTIQHGGVAVYNIVVSSVGGAGLASTIQLTFSGGPDRAISTLTPATIATGSGTTAATLTLDTPNYPTGPFTLAFLGLVALPLVRRRKRMRGLLALAAALVLLGAATGCGSGWKAQRFDVIVTATSGQLVRSAQATLISRP